MKSIQLDDVPEVLQKAIQKHLNSGFEILQLTTKETPSEKIAFESIVTQQHEKFINLYCYLIKEKTGENRSYNSTFP
ncbi:hypothetical protein [Bacillus sp. C1]